MEGVLVRGGTLLAPEGERFVPVVGDVLVVDGKIADIGPALTVDDVEVVDAADLIVLPGFVDTHRHTWQSALRHRLGDANFLEYRREVLATAAPRCRPEDVYIGTLLGAISAIDAGTTTLVDWSHIQNSPQHADAAVAALRDSGMRAIFAHGYPRNQGNWVEASTHSHPEDIVRIREQELADDSALVTLAMAARGPEMTTLEVTRSDSQLARRLGIRLSMHVGSSDFGPRFRAVEVMSREGLLGDDLTLVHLSTTSNEEMRLAREAGVSISLGPWCELVNPGSGGFALARLLDAGLRPSLSGDTETMGAGDMFTQMRATLTGARQQFEGREGGSGISVADVLSYATIEGARACGLAETTGSLSVGKDADLVMIRRSDVNLAPASDPVGAVVLGAHAGNVDAVMVRGRLLKRDGRLLGVDLRRLADDAAASCAHLLDRVGVPLVGQAI